MKREKLIEILNNTILKKQVFQIADLILDEIEKSKAPDKAGEREGLDAACEAAWRAYRYGTSDSRGPGWSDPSQGSAWQAAIGGEWMLDRMWASALAATPTPPLSPDSTGPAGATERESEDAYIARVLAMSSDEIAAEAEAADVEVPEPRSLPASLRNLRFRLEAALANRLEEGDREAIAWLNEGVIAIGAALAALSLTPMPSGITPAGASKLWDAIHEAMVCAWNLLDGTEHDASGVDQDDWDALSAAMEAMGALVPETEQPFSPSYAVPYLRAALTPSAPIGAPVRDDGAYEALKRVSLIQARELKRLDPHGTTPADLDEAMVALAASLPAPAGDVPGETK